LKSPLVRARFKESLITAEDLEICWRLARKGYKFKQIPEAEIIHHFRTTFSKFAEQQYERGIYGGELFEKYGKGFMSTVYLNSVFAVPIIVALVVLFPVLLVPMFLFPAFVHLGLGSAEGNRESFMSSMSMYWRREKSLPGLLTLLALQYVRTFSLAAGVMRYRLGSLFRKSNK
jgi:cellulose synthase/poly-beta-1,6-N-acetylglucosamine synthase-like glycosyltransferase